MYIWTKGRGAAYSEISHEIPPIAVMTPRPATVEKQLRPVAFDATGRDS